MADISSETPAPAVATTETETTRKRRSSGGVSQKILKTIDTLKAQNSKLKDEVKKVKAQLADIKSVNSRIRRIPKPADAAAASAEPSA